MIRVEQRGQRDLVGTQLVPEIRPGQPLNQVVGENRQECNSRQACADGDVVGHRHLRAEDQEHHADRGDREGEGLCIAGGGQTREGQRDEKRGATRQETEHGAERKVLACLLLVTQPSGVLGGGDLAKERWGVVVLLRIEERSLRDEARHHGRQHDCQGDGIGVGAEPRNLGDEVLDDVSEDPESGAHPEHVGFAQARQGTGGVLAVSVSAAARVCRRADPAREGDVGADERSEGQVGETCRRVGS